MTHDALRTCPELCTRDDLRTRVDMFNDSAIHNVYHTALSTPNYSKQRVTVCPVRMQTSQHIGHTTNL